jgi:hypothetical protein
VEVVVGVGLWGSGSPGPGYRRDLLPSLERDEEGHRDQSCATGAEAAPRVQDREYPSIRSWVVS